VFLAHEALPKKTGVFFGDRENAAAFIAGFFQKGTESVALQLSSVPFCKVSKSTHMSSILTDCVGYSKVLVLPP